jgi:hypothetical protein
VGFGGGTVLSADDSSEGIVSAFATEDSNETHPTGAGNSTTEGASSTPTIASGGTPALGGVSDVRAVQGQIRHVLITVTLTNPRDSMQRRGLFVTLRHEPYETTTDRVVELPPQSRGEYLVRVPNVGQVRSAMLHAVENDNYEIDVELGDLPERYGDS